MNGQNPWLLLGLYSLAFLIAYMAVVFGFAGIYLDDLNDLRESIYFSIDTQAVRGRISEERLGTVAKDWSCVQAVIGHVVPGVAFGLLFATIRFGASSR